MRRKQAQPIANDGEQLLQDLLEAAPGDNARPLRPIALRSISTQRQDVLGRYLRRTWFDRALLIGEWTVALLIIVMVGYRVWDGPIYDWLYAPAAAQALSREVSRDSTQAVKPQHTASPAVIPHTDLGLALPSSDRAPVRPVSTVDYLVPARAFVPAALPTAPPVSAPVVQPAPPVDLRPVHLRVPSIGLDDPVVEVFLQDGVWQVADYAVGYQHGTGLPGDGNVVMAGHKGVRGSVFAQLESVKAGDDVFVDAAGQRFHYRVRETGSVWPNQVSIMFPTVTPTLTLLTCTNWDLQRFVVVADLVDSAPLVMDIGG